MPELPEVETVRATLNLAIAGKTIESVKVNYEKMIKGVSVMEFITRLNGQTLTNIHRFGKYLFFNFQDVTMISHLRMEGKYYLKSILDPLEKHEHVVINFTDQTSLRYHDTRKFGTIELVDPGMEMTPKGIQSMGPEPFDDCFNSDYLKQKIKNSIRPIKSLLLDQSVVSGLGNIYVDEVLFLAKIHPESPAKSLSTEDLKNIVIYSRSVLHKAIALGGTTIRSYLSSLGVSGRFQNELNVHMRKDEPCLHCGTLITKIKVGGRGTYVCTTCQRRNNS